jgi:hypothetical protein
MANILLDTFDSDHTIHVDSRADTNPSVNDGSGTSHGNAVQTLAEAVSLVPNGGIITVWPGTYKETVNLAPGLGVNKSITIIGVNPTLCILSNNNTTSTITLNHSCKLINMGVINGGGKAVASTNSNYCLLEDCIIESTDKVWLQTVAVSMHGRGIVIKDCAIDSQYRGITTGTARGFRIEGCTVSVSGDANTPVLGTSGIVGIQTAPQSIVKDTSVYIRQIGVMVDGSQSVGILAGQSCSIERCHVENAGAATGTSAMGGQNLIANSATNGPVLIKETMLIYGATNNAGVPYYDVVDDDSSCITILSDTYTGETSFQGKIYDQLATTKKYYR